jgi:hypothetical protein
MDNITWTQNASSFARCCLILFYLYLISIGSHSFICILSISYLCIIYILSLISFVWSLLICWKGGGELGQLQSVMFDDSTSSSLPYLDAPPPLVAAVRTRSIQKESDAWPCQAHPCPDISTETMIYLEPSSTLFHTRTIVSASKRDSAPTSTFPIHRISGSKPSPNVSQFSPATPLSLPVPPHIFPMSRPAYYPHYTHAPHLPLILEVIALLCSVLRGILYPTPSLSVASSSTSAIADHLR